MQYGQDCPFQGRSLAGLKKTRTDQLVSHPKEAGLCLGVEAKHHQFQYLTTFNPALLCHVAQLLHHYSPTPDPFIRLIKIQSLFPSMDSLWFTPCAAETDSFFLPSVKQKLGGGTETFSEIYECSVCVRVLKPIMKKNKNREARSSV